MSGKSKFTKDNPPLGGYKVKFKWSREKNDYVCDKIFWQEGKGRRHYLVSMPLEKENRDMRIGDVMPIEFQQIY